MEKTENCYRLVGRQLVKLRRAGTVPYSWITDGTRWVVRQRAYSNLDQMLEDAAASYRRRLWHDQHVSVSVFTEKDAISGVIDPVTVKWDVPLGVLRGYASESFAYNMAEQIKATRRPTFIYQLGDHDPSGLDAWRDFTAKVTAFFGDRPAGWPVHFQRLAVTEAQIEEYNLPTRPTKQKDPRSRGFGGSGSVEVDAIPAPVGPAVFVTIDEERGLALLRGREAERVAYLISPGNFSWVPAWSPSGKGSLVPLAATDDIAAYCQTAGEFAVVHERRGAS